MNGRHIDTLTDFHLHKPADQVYALVAHLISVLQNKLLSEEEIYRNVSNILSEAASISILKLICQKRHVDYLQLMQDCQKYTTYHVSARLLLHLSFLPIPYVSTRLQIDPGKAQELLNELRKNFTIDDPILWLQFMLSSIEHEELRYQHSKEDLLHGLAITNQPVDTYEERKLKDRQLNPQLKPPGEP